MTDALTALTIANARVTAAIASWVLTRNVITTDARAIIDATGEQGLALAALQREIEHPPEAR